MPGPNDPEVSWPQVALIGWLALLLTCLVLGVTAMIVDPSSASQVVKDVLG